MFIRKKNSNWPIQYVSLCFQTNTYFCHSFYHDIQADKYRHNLLYRENNAQNGMVSWNRLEKEKINKINQANIDIEKVHTLICPNILSIFVYTEERCRLIDWLIDWYFTPKQHDYGYIRTMNMKWMIKWTWDNDDEMKNDMEHKNNRVNEFRLPLEKWRDG